MMCLIGNTHVTCWWIPRDGSHAGRPCAVGHKLMDHMLTLKEAEPVSCCSLLQAGFIFPKHREMTLEVLGSKEKKKQMSSPLNKRKNAREKMKSYFQHLYSPFHIFFTLILNIFSIIYLLVESFLSNCCKLSFTTAVQ